MDSNRVIMHFLLARKNGFKSIFSSILLSEPGADLGFSRGGAEFQKIFENFDDLFFFRSIRLIFRALPKQSKKFWALFEKI